MLQIAVLEAGGMEPLISLLQSIDPDVQKNALETLALMLQDHQARTAIRAQGGITPVLQMLKSEYPGIISNSVIFVTPVSLLVKVALAVFSLLYNFSISDLTEFSLHLCWLSDYPGCL